MDVRAIHPKVEIDEVIKGESLNNGDLRVDKLVFSDYSVFSV